MLPPDVGHELMFNRPYAVADAVLWVWERAEELAITNDTHERLAQNL
jgi:hypothetical protein